MLRNFKKLFIVVLSAVLITETVIPPDAAMAAGPARPSFKIVKRARKSVILKINKTKNTTGYQIFIANSRNGRYKQTAASRIRIVKITKLKKNKVYYVKIRAFKTVGYHITYGKFSKVIKIDKYGKKKPAPSVTPDVPSENIPTGSAIDETQDPSEILVPELSELYPPQKEEPEQIQIPEQTPDIDSSTWIYTEPLKNVLA